MRNWGYGEREMVILWCRELFGALLAAQNYGNIPEGVAATEVPFTDPDGTEMDNSEQLEGENIFHDDKMEGGSNKKIAASRN